MSAGGRFSLAVGSDGNVYAWGDNSYGELGDGTTTPREKPQLIPLPDGAVVAAVCAGEIHSLALDTAGKVYAWGANASGQLGDGSTIAAVRARADHHAGRATVAAVSAGQMHSLALDAAARSMPGATTPIANSATAPIPVVTRQS